MSGNLSDLAANWQGATTDASAIERALGQMLRELNPPTSPDDSHPLTRTSVLNLIVRLPRDTADAREVEPLWEVSERHPSRTIVLATDATAAESGLDASAMARCQLGAGTRGRVCFEEVLLVARGALADHLASVVAPLLVPDLPVVLWWLGSPPAPDEELLRLCDHLIVESADFDAAELDVMSRLVESLVDQRVIGDLTWSALAPWREHLAQLFDAPAARPYQRRVTTARIQWAAGGTESQSLLLLGWLATRLGWQEPTPVDDPGDDSRTICFRHVGGTVEVRFGPAGPVDGSAPGEVTAVKLECLNDRRQATFEVARDCGGGCASQRATLPDLPTVNRVVPIAPPALAVRLGQELACASRDPNYEASLAVARSLASRR